LESSNIKSILWPVESGKSNYLSPDGIIEGEISLKRQYFIENQSLQKYSDIDLKANDELLQIALEEKADDRLKNIVATIQAEQNNIIRADMNKPLIVQGVAGSR
jgi:DNA helicase-2/ATP-dependent DNA helicase PcrA